MNLPKQKFAGIWPHLDERIKRTTAASEAKSIGRRGISIVHRACGLSRLAIANGIQEINLQHILPPGRIRSEGGGRKPAEFHAPGIIDAIERLIETETRGDLESPLKWVCESTRAIAAELTKRKHPIRHTKFAQFLHAQDYSLHSNRKTEEGTDHEDRDAQFRHISATVRRHLASKQPVIRQPKKKGNPWKL